jgi:hypothetical protein
MMSAEENKAIARRLVEEGLNQQNIDAIPIHVSEEKERA